MRSLTSSDARPRRPGHRTWPRPAGRAGGCRRSSRRRSGTQKGRACRGPCGRPATAWSAGATVAGESPAQEPRNCPSAGTNVARSTGRAEKAAATPRRFSGLSKHARGGPLAFPGRIVDTLVVHARRLGLDRPGGGGDATESARSCRRPRPHPSSGAPARPRPVAAPRAPLFRSRPGPLRRTARSARHVGRLR